jgi:hypothetical protein
MMTLVYECTLKHPARILIFGPTFSGKTTLVTKILENQEQLFNLKFDRILYCSDGSMLKTRNQVENIETYECFDKDLFDQFDPNMRNCLIIDDFMHRAANDIQISELFTKRSHHQNVTIILLMQNIFPKSKYMTDIKRNASYIFLMSNPVDEKSIKLLSQHLDPSNPSFIYNCFIDATKNKPYSYLFLDLNPGQSNEVRVRTNVIESTDGSSEQIVYLKAKEYSQLCRRIGSNCEGEK